MKKAGRENNEKVKSPTTARRVPHTPVVTYQQKTNRTRVKSSTAAAVPQGSAFGRRSPQRARPASPNAQMRAQMRTAL